MGGLACDPSLLRTTLSRPALSGLGGRPPAPCPLPSLLLTSAGSRSFPRVWQLLLWPETLGQPLAQGQRAGLEGQQPGEPGPEGGCWREVASVDSETSQASKAERAEGWLSFAVTLAYK